MVSLELWGQRDKYVSMERICFGIRTIIIRPRSSLRTLCLILLNNALQNIFTVRTDVENGAEPYKHFNCLASENKSARLHVRPVE